MGYASEALSSTIRQVINDAVKGKLMLVQTTTRRQTANGPVDDKTWKITNG